MVNFKNENFIIKDKKFYYTIEKQSETNDIIIMCKILSNYDYIFLNEPRFIFVARNKFAKKYSLFIFKKDYSLLTIQEKFFLTYFIFTRNIKKIFNGISIRNKI